MNHEMKKSVILWSHDLRRPRCRPDPRRLGGALVVGRGFLFIQSGSELTKQVTKQFTCATRCGANAKNAQALRKEQVIDVSEWMSALVSDECSKCRS